MTGTQIINIHVFNTPLTLILSFFLLNWVHYQSYKNAPVDVCCDAVDVCCDAVDVCCDAVDAEDVCCDRMHFRLKDKYTTASKVSCLMEKDTKEKRTIILQDQKYCDASNIS